MHYNLKNGLNDLRRTWKSKFKTMILGPPFKSLYTG